MSLGTGVLLERPQARESAPGSIWHDIVLPLLLTRLVLTAIGFFAVNTMLIPQEFELLSRTSVTRGWLNTWARWDAIWYLRIVRDGYFYTPGEQSSVAFFPLYPMLMYLGGFVFGRTDLGWLLSGVIASNALLGVAMYYLRELVRMDFDEQTARRAVLYVLIAPTTVFLSAVYPMSLILAIALAAFYYARLGRWHLTAAIAACAPLARPDGVLLLAGLVFEYLRQRNFHLRKIGADFLPMLVLPGLALATWLLFLHLQFGDALAFVKTQRAWPSSPITSAMEDWDALIGVVAAGACLALLVFGSFRLRASYVIYALMHLALLLSAPRATSLPRFVLVLFPVYMALAILGRNRQFDLHWTIISTGLAALFLLRYALCYFVG